MNWVIIDTRDVRIGLLERRLDALGVVSINRNGRVRITRTLTAGEEIETNP
jgi:hypothetical protein